MNARPLLIATVLILALLASAKAQQRPNIVLFLVDDMGVMDTSVPFLTDEDGNAKHYPLNEFYRTPSMKRLAEQGIRFNNFCAMSVCSPTRISLMTGQNAARHRTTNWIDPDQNNRGSNGPPQWNWQGLQPDDVTLARLLQDAGYRTIHVGKGHFAPRLTPGADPKNLGFDVNVGGGPFGHPGSYFGQQKYGLIAGHLKHAVPHLDAFHNTDIFLTEALTIEAKKRIDDAVSDDRPFFLYMAHYAVHAPFESDPRFAAHYKKSGKSPQAQAFATLIEGMDKSLGDLLDHLEKMGVAENTLVFFVGDNGSDAPLGHEHAVSSSAPLRGKKGSHYEGGMRVPFIAAWARPNPDSGHQQRVPVAAGTINSQLAAVYDLFPTILAAADVRVPGAQTLDGSTLDQMLNGRHDPSRSPSFLMHYPHAHRSNYFTSFRDGDWKVIYHYFPSPASGGSHYQLYNLATDPFEQTDLAQAQPEHLSRMIGGMIESLERHGALYPVSESTDHQPLKPKLPQRQPAS